MSFKMNRRESLISEMSFILGVLKCGGNVEGIGERVENVFLMSLDLIQDPEKQWEFPEEDEKRCDGDGCEGTGCRICGNEGAEAVQEQPEEEPEGC